MIIFLKFWLFILINTSWLIHTCTYDDKTAKKYQKLNSQNQYFSFFKLLFFTYLSHWSWHCYFLNKAYCSIKIPHSRSKEHWPVYWTLFHWNMKHCNEINKNLLYFYILHCSVPTYIWYFLDQLQISQRLEELGLDLMSTVGSPSDWLQLYWTDALLMWCQLKILTSLCRC